ncbi:MAG: type II secretion system F family protein [Chromatiales bacterium]
MPYFSYKAVTSDGEVIKGLLEEASREAAIEKIHSLGQVPIRITTTENAIQSSRLFSLKKKLSNEQIAIFTRELSSLLKAGMPLDRALSTIISLAEDKSQLSKTLTQVLDNVRNGSSLASALEMQDKTFSTLYISLVRAGEAGGALDLVLERLSEHLERNKEINDTLLSAFIYPAILLFVAMLSIFILLAYVIPQFSELFEGMGASLPLATQIVMVAGDLMQSYGWVGLVAILLGWWWLRRQLLQPQGRYRWHSRVMKLPVVGDLITKVEVARFSRTLGTLLSNGVPLLKAITIVKDVIGNQVISEGIGTVVNSLKAGQRLADPLSEHTTFPPFAIHMIQVGEESGNLEGMLTQVADIFDKEVSTSVKRALALLEPVLILTLGLLIAGIVMSILVAILGVNQLVF